MKKALGSYLCVCFRELDIADSTGVWAKEARGEAAP